MSFENMGVSSSRRAMTWLLRGLRGAQRALGGIFLEFFAEARDRGSWGSRTWDGSHVMSECRRRLVAMASNRDPILLSS